MNLPLDRICSLPTILLMIQHSFPLLSSLIMRMIKWRRRQRTYFNEFKINLKFIESYYIATQFTNHFMCNTIFNPEIRKPRLIEVMEFAPVTQVVSTESESHLRALTIKLQCPQENYAATHYTVWISLQLLTLMSHPIFSAMSIHLFCALHFLLPLD